MILGISVLIFKYLSIVLLMYIILRLIKQIPFYKESKRLSGPPTLPLIGNSLFFIGNTTDIFKNIQTFIATYKSPFRIWLGEKFMYVVHDPEHLKIVLYSSEALQKGNILIKIAKPWLGNGIFLAPVSIWRTHRKLINTAFNPRILKSFIEVFVIQSNILVNKLENELNGGEFEVFNYISRCTLDLVCETVMGISTNAQIENSSYYTATKRMFEIMYTRLFKIWLHPNIIFYNTNLGMEYKKLIKFLHSFTDDVIKKRKAILSDLENEKTSTNSHDDKQQKSFLNLLIDMVNKGNKFTNEELREETDSMLIAANETTSTATTFVLLMLANHPEIQTLITKFIYGVQQSLMVHYTMDSLKHMERDVLQMLYMELCQIYGSDNPSSHTIKPEDLQRMEYLDRVIKETLRLFPLGPMLIRQLNHDLQMGDHKLLRGCYVLLGILAVHRSDKYWPNPLKFDPDRFLTEELSKRHPYCYLPFSMGPRNCIGMKYATMAIKTMVSTIIRKYIIINDKIVPISEIELKADLVLKSTNPVMIKIKKRMYDKS